MLTVIKCVTILGNEIRKYALIHLNHLYILDIHKKKKKKKLVGYMQGQAKFPTALYHITSVIRPNCTVGDIKLNINQSDQISFYDKWRLDRIDLWPSG